MTGQTVIQRVEVGTGASVTIIVLPTTVPFLEKKTVVGWTEVCVTVVMSSLEMVDDSSCTVPLGPPREVVKVTVALFHWVIVLTVMFADRTTVEVRVSIGVTVVIL